MGSRIIIIIINGVKEPIHVYQNCYTNRILIFDGYVKEKESSKTRIIIWVNAILNQLGNVTIMPRFEDSCMIYRPE